MSDTLSAAVLATIDANEAERLEMYRCAAGCRLAGTYRICGTLVWVLFGSQGEGRDKPQAFTSRPDGPLNLRCRRHSAEIVEFRP